MKHIITFIFDNRDYVQKMHDMCPAQAKFFYEAVDMNTRREFENLGKVIGLALYRSMDGAENR